MRRTLLTLATLLLGTAPLTAQGAPPPLVCPTLPDAAQVDQIVAVVGDSVILFTDLQQECRLAEQRNQQAVRDGQPPLQLTVQDLLDNLVNIQVLLQHAARDSTVIPSEQDLTNRVTMQLDTVRASFANEAAFQQALTQQGLTLNTYRDQLRAQIRTRLIQDAYTRRLLQSAPTPVVSEAEMRAFYEERKGELQALPELLTVQQVPIRSGASEEAWERARMKADSLYLLVIRGADFAELARQHSADSASAVNGGDLGSVTRGLTVPEFERAAFALRDGGVSAPVRTEYGYHIIRVERSRGATEKFVRHILIRPDSDPSDIERARTTAEDVANRIRSGESALRLAQQYGDPTIPRELRVFRGQEAQTVPPDYAQRLVGAQQGAVIGPFDANLNGPEYVVVMQVTQVRAAGQATFEEVRDQIRDVLTAQKRQERIYKDLRDKTYVEVRYGR